MPNAAHGAIAAAVAVGVAAVEEALAVQDGIGVPEIVAEGRDGVVEGRGETDADAEVSPEISFWSTRNV